MPHAERDGSRIVLTTDYREKEMVKQIPGVKWDTSEQAWWAPLAYAACIQLRGVFGASLTVGPELGAWFKHEDSTRVQPCLALREAADAEDLAALFTKLRPFQRAGTKFLATGRNSLIADEMGLGKTVQAIAALELLGDEAYPALIVCPNSMKLTWEAEFHRWAPGREPVVIHGSAAKRRAQIESLRDGTHDVGIINYESLRNHTRLASYGSVTLSDKEKEPKELNQVAFKTVVADEAHRAKDPRAKQTRALWFVGAGAEHRFALTGTPIANSPEDAWSLLRFISPADFPAKTRFIERYALEDWNVFGFKKVIGIKPETQDELFRIIDPLFIRRTKAAVLPELPPMTYATRWVEMEPKQAKAYAAMAKEMLAQLDSGVLMATNPLVRATRLTQFASAYGELGEPYFDVRAHGTVYAAPFTSWEDAEAARQQGVVEQRIPFDAVVHDGTPLLLTEPSCKVDALEEIVDELGDQRAIVFAESKQLIDLAIARLTKAKVGCAKITGDVPLNERGQAIREFNLGNLKILGITLGAGGEGLSFPGCTTAIFLQRSFSMIKNQQAEARISGIGRGEEGVSSEVIDIVTADTIEQHIREVGEDKLARLEEFVRDEETLKKWLK